MLKELPLIVAGGPRRATEFVRLIPGVSTGGTDEGFTARFNGGLRAADEALVDGISMIEGTIANSGMIAFEDFAISPEMIDEIRVLTSNYEAQYGTTNSAVIQATTKSGTNEYHGGIFAFHRNTVFNARQFGAPERGRVSENNFGGSLGGPVPGMRGGKHRAYFYYLHEQFRAAGGVVRPTASIPSLLQRSGEFTDWVDASGNLIPVFDPATTRTGPDGSIVRDQFNCQGIPNKICPGRFANSLANGWLQHLPTPTSSGPLNNFLSPTGILSETNLNTSMNLIKGDYYRAERDHFSFMFRPQRHPDYEPSTILPRIISSRGWSPPSYIKRDLYRVNWDHTFSPTLLNTLNYGSMDRDLADESINRDFVDQLPQIPGVAHEVPSEIRFSDGFRGYGNSTGTAENNVQKMQNYIFTNLTTWVKGRHTIKFGGEYRFLEQNSPLFGLNGSTFSFDRGPTALRGINSGSPIAGFLLEQVSSANTFIGSGFNRIKIRMDAYIAHVNDSWRVNDKFTLNLGLRWDLHRPSWTDSGQNSFLDTNRPNPGAGGLPGALAFAGTSHGEASFGRRYPEDVFKKAFSPRVGIAYRLDEKTSIRAGYGIYFSQPFYGGWGGGVDTAGFTASPVFSSTQGGLVPAFILAQGFPQDFQRPPFIDPSFRNGQSILYRDPRGNRLTYSQQWNLSVERQVSNDSTLSLAYVANEGRRLPSNVAPINTLNPQHLSLGEALFDEFAPGQASLHGVPLPYDGWVGQMKGCAPSVAQALLPFPQFCGATQAVNKYAGTGSYHSFQLKFEKQVSEGVLRASRECFRHMSVIGRNRSPTTIPRMF